MKRVVIAGMGPGSSTYITAATQEAIARADIIIGAQRLLDGLTSGSERRFAYTRSEQIVQLLEQHDWQHACVLMSGDTGIFSGARRLLQRLESLDGCEVSVLPGISSAQYFAARLGRPWQDWRLCSAHGVDVNLPALAARHTEVFLVTGGENSVAALCASLCNAGMEHTVVTVGERLSYPEECISAGTAGQFAQKNFDQLSVMLVEYNGVSQWPYANTGIPDDEFIRGDVPMTKQEVRAVALAKLRVRQDDVVFDIGAGTGSVSVELALLCGSVYAVEHKPEAVRLIRQNAARFGLHNLHIIEGEAPDALAGLPAPNAAFIGGSGGRLREIVAQLRANNPAVRLCVACVTLETLSEATALLAGSDGFEVCQIAATRSRQAGSYHLLAAQNPVFLISAGGTGQ